MRKTLVAGIIAGVVVYIWYSIAWVVLPHHNMVTRDIQDTAPILDFLKSQNLESGVYNLPSQSEMQKDFQSYSERCLTGPVIPFMVYVANGHSPMNAWAFLFGLVYCMLAGWLAAELLQVAWANLATRGKRILYVLGFALFGVLTISLTYVNWFSFPFTYMLMDIIDLLVGWTIGAFIIHWWLNRTPKGATA